MTGGSSPGDLPAHIAAKIQHSLPPDLIHDLRTPLGHVLGYAELLKEQAEDEGHTQLLPYINKIHAAAQHLLELMNANFHSSRETEP